MTLTDKSKTLIATILRLLGLSGPRNLWRTFTILFALLNLKNLPFAWHIRFFSALSRHVFLDKALPPSSPKTIFLPVVTTSRSPLLEGDYNIHKSNSTYFSDLDVNRTHLIACVLKRGLQTYAERRKKYGDKRLLIALGGVSCLFRREIGMYEEFEVWSRILTWDRKWMFIVSHFVQRGAVRPKGYVLRDPSRAGWRLPSLLRRSSDGKKVVKKVEEIKSQGSSGTSSPSNGQPQYPAHSAVFASAISKYVFKNGRITIPPETVLERSGLLPARPVDTPAKAPASPPEPQTDSWTAAALPQPRTPRQGLEESAIDLGLAASGLTGISGMSKDAIIDSSLTLGDEDDDTEWDWARMERTRAKGMKIAELMANLDVLHGVFKGEEEVVLGEY